MSVHGILLAGLLALLSAGCRSGAPVTDPAGAPGAPGTISGTIRAVDGDAPIDGRVVEVVRIQTGERQRTTTDQAGGFTFTVMPGRYRVSLALRDGESIVERPDVTDVAANGVDAGAHFVIAALQVTRPRFATPANPALGAPVA